MRDSIPILPDHPDLSYGPHERQTLDLYLSPSRKTPSPLVIYIHGGGFMSGDKRKYFQQRFSGDFVKGLLDAGFCVASVNYRLTVVHGVTAPVPYLDCARALQFLRLNSDGYGLDPLRVVATGTSAGAATSLWLAFKGDLAMMDHPDPVLRESTKLSGVAAFNAQCSYDPRFAESLGMPRPNFELHDFFLPFYGLSQEEVDSPKAFALYKAMAPITYLTPPPPPVFLHYGQLYPLGEITPATHKEVMVHNPRFGIALKERMDAMGLKCLLQYHVEQKGRTGSRLASTIPGLEGDASDPSQIEKENYRCHGGEGEPMGVIEFLKGILGSVNKV